VVLAVRDGALVVITGARARAALDGLDARARAADGADAGVAAGGGSEGAGGESVVLTARGAGTTSGEARAGYGTAAGDGETARATGRLVLPWWVIDAARRAVRAAD
jgi:hypothetical protein